MTLPFKILAPALAAAILSACGGGDDQATLQIQIQGLENLGSSHVYEGWLMVNGAPKSAGRFSVNANGALSQTQFTVDRADADAATAYILTIEPAVNDLPAPSDTHLVAGDFNSARTSASLSIGHPAALGSDFSTAAGKFFLATPTNPGAGTDTQGIWFIDPSSGTMRAGLTLPTLPKGWMYEGWVVVNGQASSTGRFTNPAAMDSDGAGAAKGPSGNGPAFPGQDFINPAKVLPGGMAVISIEPEADNSPAPFLLKPLITNPVANLTGGANLQSMVNQAAATAPKGTVTLIR